MICKMVLVHHSLLTLVRYACEFASNVWSRVEVSAEGFDLATFCGRFNSMLTACDNKIIMYTVLTCLLTNIDLGEATKWAIDNSL